jgi:hypothetical protein
MIHLVLELSCASDKGKTNTHKHDVWIGFQYCYQWHELDYLHR